MYITSRRRKTGCLRQNAARRVILSGYTLVKHWFSTGVMPISSINSIIFRNHGGVFLALAGDDCAGFQSSGGR